MNEIGLSTFTYVIREHWLSAFLILRLAHHHVRGPGASLVCEAAVAGDAGKPVRRRTRTGSFAAARGKQQQALEMIARMSEEVWDLPEDELQLGFDALNRRAMNIVRSIGAVYNPSRSA